MGDVQRIFGRLSGVKVDKRCVRDIGEGRIRVDEEEGKEMCR